MSYFSQWVPPLFLMERRIVFEITRLQGVRACVCVFFFFCFA